MKNMSPEHKKWTLTGALLLVLGFNLSVHHFQKDEFGVAILDAQSLRDMNAEGGVIELASGAAGPANAAAKKARAKKARAEKARAEKARAEKARKAAAASDEAGDAKKALLAKEAADEADRLKKEQEAKDAEAKKNKEAAAGAQVKPDTETKIEGVKLGDKAVIVTLKASAADPKKTEATVTVVGCTDCAPQVQTVNMTIAGILEFRDHFMQTLELQIEKSKKDGKVPQTAAEMKVAEEKRKNEAFTSIIDECRKEKGREEKGKVDVEEIACRSEKMIELFDSNSKITEKEKQIETGKFTAFFRKNIAQKLAQLLVKKNVGRFGQFDSFEQTDNFDQADDSERAVELIGQLVKDLPDQMESSRALLVTMSGNVVKKLGQQYVQARAAQDEYVREMKEQDKNYNKFRDPVYMDNELIAQNLLSDTRVIGNSLGEAIRCGLGDHLSSDSSSAQQARFARYVRGYNGALNTVGSVFQKAKSATLADKATLKRNSRTGNGEDRLVITKAGASAVNPIRLGPGRAVPTASTIRADIGLQVGGGSRTRQGSVPQAGIQGGFSAGTQAGIQTGTNAWAGGGRGFSGDQILKPGTPGATRLRPDPKALGF
jgi:hypothetical protein